MKKATKIWLIIATSLIIAGLILFATVMTEYHWDFTKLSTRKYETNTYEIKEAFSNISINTDTADIAFVWSYDGKCKVECYEEESAKHSVGVQANTLDIQQMNTKAWYNYIGINFGSPKITVYLPKTEPEAFKFEKIDISSSTGDVDLCACASDSLKIRTSTGYIRVEDVSAGALDLSVSTGKITVTNVVCENNIKLDVSTGKTVLTNVTCKNLISNGDTGDITLNSVIAAEKFLIERDTGDVKFDSSDAAEIFVETDTGDVEGSLLTDKNFTVETDTGKVDVPKTATGGRCEISTDTGDIEITIK